MNEDSGTVTISGTIARNHQLGYVEISGSVAQRGVEDPSKSPVVFAVGNRWPTGARPLASLTTKRFVPGVARSQLGRLVSMVFPMIRESPDQVTRRVAVILEPASQ